jgi:uncharacterized protein DUF3558
MKRRLSALAAASFAVVALGGCGQLDAHTTRPVAADAAEPLPTPSGSAVSGLGVAERDTSAGRDSGDLPDPCTLLSNTEVVRLTGRHISEMDRDDAKPGDGARYCQWQQDGGQLALFLARTTPADFDAGVSQAQPVDGVEGYDAFSLAGHLYVRDDDIQVDVYSHGGTDEQDLTEEIRVVKVVLPRLED